MERVPAMKVPVTSRRGTSKTGFWERCASLRLAAPYESGEPVWPAEHHSPAATRPDRERAWMGVRAVGTGMAVRRARCPARSAGEPQAETVGRRRGAGVPNQRSRAAATQERGAWGASGA